jgi:D-arabinose 1-dehydrogenase-like Zn-dependent alcohol dehydrogenase
MRAVVIEAFGQVPRVVDVPDPAPPPHGVVVAVEATGVCRSDWHAWQGHDPDVTLPHVPGHELAGTVVAVGGDVRRWRTGDRVTTPFVTACGTCPECADGHQQVCRAQTQPGFTGWGSFAVIAHELQVLGSHGMAAHDYPRLLALVGSGRFPLARLVGRTLPLEAGPRALADVATGPAAGVTVLLPAEPDAA